LLPTLSPENETWDYKINRCRLPPYTRLLLADVDAGSDTPSMASKVLKWRKESGNEGKYQDRILPLLMIFP
jgi:phosphomevalonate kinase